MDVSVVIPAYNEASCLEQSVKRVAHFLKTKDYQSEIILVIEPSRDETLVIAQRIAQEMQSVRLILNEKRMGKGYSVARGLLQATGEIALFLDADLSTPIETLDRVMPLMLNHDVVIGSRHTNDARLIKKQSFFRRISGSLFRLIARKGFQLDFSDTQCGFKVFRQSIIPDLFHNLKINGFTFDIEILLRAKALNLKVGEIGVNWTDADHSSVKAVHAFHMFHELYRLHRYQMQLRRRVCGKQVSPSVLS